MALEYSIRRTMMTNTSPRGSAKDSRHHLSSFQPTPVSSEMMPNNFRGAGHGSLYPKPMLKRREAIAAAVNTIVHRLPYVGGGHYLDVMNHRQLKLGGSRDMEHNNKEMKFTRSAPAGTLTTSTPAEATKKPATDEANLSSLSKTPDTLSTNLLGEKKSKKVEKSKSPVSKKGDSSNGDQSRVYIDQIAKEDILCGRGGRSNNHYGNKRYRQVIHEMKMRYKCTEGKLEKTDLSKAIVGYVFDYGGRFIRKDEKNNGRYYLLTPKEARRKTSQALREGKDSKWMA